MAGVLPVEDRQEALVEALLHQIGLLDEARNGRPSWPAFRDLRSKISDQFTVEWTTLSLTMCRLLYAIACCGQPRSIVVLGSHVGFAAAWLIRDRTDSRCGEPVEHFDGIDPDRAANRIARMNCAALGHRDHMTIHDTTGQHYLAAPVGGIDMLLIDIDDPVTRKQAYRGLLDLAAPHLRPSALVLAHDTLVPRFAEDMEAFHQWIDDDPMFDGPWVLPVDDCGLTVARRRPD